MSTWTEVKCQADSEIITKAENGTYLSWLARILRIPAFCFTFNWSVSANNFVLTYSNSSEHAIKGFSSRNLLTNVNIGMTYKKKRKNDKKCKRKRISTLGEETKQEIFKSSHIFPWSVLFYTTEMPSLPGLYFINYIKCS